MSNKEEKKIAKNNAFKTIFKLVEEKGSPEDKKALSIIRPSLYGIVRSGGGTAAHNLFAAKFDKVGTQMNETNIFNEFKAGRKECASYIKKSLKSATPEERKWITFDPKSGIYKLIAIGEEAPEDWTGYVPVNIEVEDLK